MNQPADLIYYLRHRIFGNVVVESALRGEPVQNLKGFIRLTPEITKPEDVTPEVMEKLKAEADAWVLANPRESLAFTVIDATAIVRPSLTLRETLAPDGSKTMESLGVWSAAEITAHLDPFNVTGPHDQIRVEIGDERWDFQRVTMVLAPGHKPQDGEPNRYILVFSTVKYSKK